MVFPKYHVGTEICGDWYAGLIVGAFMQNDEWHYMIGDNATLDPNDSMRVGPKYIPESKVVATCGYPPNYGWQKVKQ